MKKMFTPRFQYHAALTIILLCFLSSLTYSQSLQTLPYPSNNNQTSYAAAGGFYGPMAITTTTNQYSRYAYVYPQLLIGSSNSNVSGTFITNGSVINSLEFDRGYNNSTTMNNTGNFKIYLVNLSSATTDWGSTSLNWITQTSASTLVYNANPASVINAATSKPGNVSFSISPFTYTGGALGVLVEYTQTTGQPNEISWGYENSSTIGQYVANSALGVVGTGTPSNTLGNTNSQSNPVAVRHPTLKINFTAPTITTGAIAGSPFCVTSTSGATISIPFTSTGTFTSNTYTAQLSNSSGSFATPVNIGTLVSNANSGNTINGTIPAGTTTGIGYKVRVISSNPAVTGSTSATTITINLASNSIVPTATQNINAGTNGTTLTVTEQSTASSRTWYYSTTSGGSLTSTGVTATTYTPNFATQGTYYVVCKSTFACATVTSNEVQINVSAAVATGVISGSPFCPGSSVTVPFTSSGTFAANNIYTAQLSNSSGSFSSPVSIGTINSNANTGNIPATIPSSTTAGTGYRIRVISSNPSVTPTTDNGTNLAVSGAPTTVTITPSNPTICSGSIQALTAGGGLQGPGTITENFNGTTNTFAAVNNSTGFLSDINAAAWTLRPNGYLYNDFLGDDYVFHSNDNSQFYLSNSDDQGPAFLQTPATNTTLTSSVINTTGYQTLNLTFYQNFITGFSGNDVASVQVSTDGSNFTTLTNYNTDQGTETYNSTTNVFIEGFTLATVNLNAYINKPTLYIRFKYFANFGFWWAIDNVSITGNNQGTINWLPITNLYKDAAATIPYTTGYQAATVYTKYTNAAINPVDLNYTATATNSSGCTTAGSATVTVAATLANTAVSVPPGAICSGSGTTVAFSGAAGSVLSYTRNGSAQPTITLNASGNTLLTVPSVTQNTTYQLSSATSGTNTSCMQNLSTTTPATVSLRTDALWTGSASTTNWNTGANWCAGSAPGSNVDVTIGSTNSFYPTLPGNITVANLTINPTNTLTIGSNTLTVNGAISGSGSITGSSTSNFAVGGTSALNFTTSSNILKNLTINGGIVTLNNALNITAGTTPGIITVANGATLVTNGNLTLKSDANGTAAVAANTSVSPYITGNVRAERYIDGGNTANGKRAWRLITSPISGVNINSAWQEGQVYNSTTGTNYLTSSTIPATQPVRYGTLITSNLTVPSTANGEGYDYTGGVTSIKQYAPAGASGSWLPLADNQSSTNPKLGTLQDVGVQPAYMLFVRGDRSIGATTTQSSYTTLRPQGSLKQGSQTIGTIHSTSNQYEVAGNPYASTIDFSLVHSQNSNLIKDQYAVWVSKLGTYGAYVYVASDGIGGYTATPNPLDGTGSSIPTGDHYLHSGEGFLVYPNTATGDITVNETVKAPGQQAPVSTFRLSPSTDRKLYVNLNQKTSDTSVTLADGFMVRFDPSYTSAIDEDDAQKPVNFNENLGILSHGSDFIVEARADVEKTDTVQLHLWNTTIRSYQLQIKGDNFASAAGLHAFLEDSYLKTRQEVSLAGSVTTVDFAVNSDAASYDHSRFRIVFQNDATVLPVTLTSVKAAPASGGVNVSWTVTNETNMKRYTVERSIDGGNTYTTIATQEAKNNPAAALTSYQSFDALPKTGDNLYRIRMEANNGQVSYSSVVKVTLGGDGEGIQITLYPNPVRANGKVSLQLANLKAGTYLVSVYSSAGQTVYQKKITIAQSNTTQSEELKLGSGPAQGSYPVRITDSKGALIYTDKLVVGR